MVQSVKKSSTKQIQDYQDTGWFIGTLIVAYEILPMKKSLQTLFRFLGRKQLQLHNG